MKKLVNQVINEIFRQMTITLTLRLDIPSFQCTVSNYFDYHMNHPVRTMQQRRATGPQQRRATGPLKPLCKVTIQMTTDGKQGFGCGKAQLVNFTEIISPKPIMLPVLSPGLCPPTPGSFLKVRALPPHPTPLSKILF